MDGVYITEIPVSRPRRPVDWAVEWDVGERLFGWTDPDVVARKRGGRYYGRMGKARVFEGSYMFNKESWSLSILPLSGQ